MRIDVKFSEVVNVTDGGYERGYADGQSAGYESGFEVGKTQGYETGKTQGYEDGYNAGSSTFDEFLSGSALGDITSNAETVANSAMASKTGLTAISLPKAKAIDGRAFILCSDLKSVDMPVVETIGNAAFRSTGLTSITIPATIQTIESIAIADNFGLNTAYILGKPTSMASDAFKGCDAMTDIYVVWGEGEVASAPWGATNATVHYNYVPE